MAALIAGVGAPAVAVAAEMSPFSSPSVVFGMQPAAGPESPVGANVWQLDFGPAPPAPVPAPRVMSPLAAAVALDLAAVTVPLEAVQDAQAPVRRPVAFTYSEGYELRAKIHKYASFLTLPIFGAQALLGLKLDQGSTSEPVRATHAAIATTMVGLFGVNSVTGVWNLWEGRANPSGRGRRLLHGVLMLASDAGFVATGLLAPTNDGGGNRGAHKAVAFTSIGTATLGYLIMLFGQ
ncbi:MAG: hypothetical protein ABI880_10595 [Acidobacteriota bacterium]